MYYLIGTGFSVEFPDPKSQSYKHCAEVPSKTFQIKVGSDDGPAQVRVTLGDAELCAGQVSIVGDIFTVTVADDEGMLEFEFTVDDVVMNKFSQRFVVYKIPAEVLVIA